MIHPLSPYLGWNSWDCYGAAVTEATVRANAEFMAKYLKPYGWEYIVVDIEWFEPAAASFGYNPFPHLSMDEYGRLTPAPNRFPSAADGAGFRPLADYVHSLGLKFGIHIMRGIPREAVHNRLPVKDTDITCEKIASASSICHWNGDMYGISTGSPHADAYYKSIFELYAEWGVDFIKCDDIAREMPRCEKELRMLSKAMKECGREMVLSLSPGPAKLEFAQLYRETSNMWRMTDDFWDSWQSLYDMFERCERWACYVTPGHYPDCDMLPIGPIRQIESPDNRTRFTEDEQVTMMNLWCVFRSPLMIGGDMPRFDEFTMSLLTNTDLLEMSEKSRHARQVWRYKDGESEVVLWTAMKSDGGQYAVIFNIGEVESEVEIKLYDDLETSLTHAKDIWTKEEFDVKDAIKTKLRPHESKAFVLS